ncbi:putative bifunctional diguanylate cyclase/phosphodiesterase [Aquibium microcysteis]|uniref:putative bifunctional diguanylate cyclase/phosphodiesterase n=1 Tax=Aquibium microcysteis TaxID=675281 RepID=UPI00165D21B6|nr:EAL domain-containing protein [Aquibium microcysteis]
MNRLPAAVAAVLRGLVAQSPLGRWYRLSGLAPDASPEVASIRAAQMRSMLRYTPVMMGANVVNALCVLIGIVQQVANAVLLALWTALVIAFALQAMAVWIAGRHRPPREKVSSRGLWRTTRQAALLGLLWGILPAVWYPELDQWGQILVGTLVTGMICCGAFALATVPSAGTAYVLALMAGSLVGLIRADIPHAEVIAVLLLAYAVAVTYAVFGTGKLFVEHFEAETALKHNGEVIQLLLNEFEENGSDWLFELDEHLRIVSCSPRFLDVVADEEHDLRGRRFGDLLAAAGQKSLFAALQGGRAFRDVVVEAGGPDGTRWWSVTAGPLFDSEGRICGWRGVGSDVTEAKLAKDRIVWMATTDQLTGLPNRLHFRERAERAIDRCRASGAQVGLASLDLDGFKQVNDTLGHAAGDELLARIALRLHDFARDGVTIGRLGGDEFGVLIECEAGSGSMVGLLEKIVVAISAPIAIGDSTVSVGGTAGLAVTRSADEDIDRLMSNADTALYAAKEQQRGSVVRFSEAMQKSADEKRGLADDLKLAVAERQLELHYQPIVDASTLRVVAAEALLRWRHPRRGLLSPEAFIGIAEATGQIGRIGNWVLQQACRDAAAWPDHVGVAVNVSPAQLVTNGTGAAVRAALATSGLPAGRLELEITEAVFVRHGTQAEEFMRDMNGVGVRIALDDFGTGYSSLGYITRFPVGKLKIDRSFVSGGAAIKERNAIISAIVGIARSLNMITTAEGVENPGELAWVRNLGCTQIQGYHVARPMTAADFAAYLLSREPELEVVVRQRPAAIMA